jgi:putative transposase
MRLIRVAARHEGGAAVNMKRVYRVMKTHGLLLERHTGTGQERRHDGRVAVDRSDTRWCSDGFEVSCDNGERVRIAFTLDCCDREAISWVATTGGIANSGIRDLMIESVERRFGLANRLPVPIEWLSDNGSPYTAPRHTGAGPRDRAGAAHDADREPAVERHGRGLRQNLQAGLRARQCSPQCGECAAPARPFVRALQSCFILPHLPMPSM